MRNGAPVGRMIGGDGTKTFDLMAGPEIPVLSEAAVRQVAETYAAGNAVKGKISELGTVRVGQWLGGLFASGTLDVLDPADAR